MKNPGGGPTRGRLWPQMALAMAMLVVASNVGSASADPYLYSSPPPPYEYKSPPPPSPSPPPPYVYKSPPPPSPSPPPPYHYSSPPPPKHEEKPPYEYKSPPPPSPSPPPPYHYSSPPPPSPLHHRQFTTTSLHHHRLRTTTLLHRRLCRHHTTRTHTPTHTHTHTHTLTLTHWSSRCYDWAYPEKSHDKKHLKGAVVEVTCKAGDKEVKAYGTTKSNGKYSITVEGFDYRKYGGKECEAKLHAPPKGSPYNIPTKLHGGDKGAELRVKSKDKYEVVLYAKPFAYAPKTPSEECYKPKPKPEHPPYVYKSPPPPAPTYVYKSPPPPAYIYKSPPPPPPVYYYKSPPPPVYYYKSPPPPTHVSSPPYVYKSPPPPSPKYVYSSPPPPAYVYKSPPPPSPKYVYNSPPPPVYYYKSPPPPPYHYSSPPPPKHVEKPPYYYTSPPPPPPKYIYNSPPPPAYLSPTTSKITITSSLHLRISSTSNSILDSRISAPYSHQSCFSLKSGIKEASISAHQASNPSPFNKGLAVSHDSCISTSLVAALQIVLLFSSWSGFVGKSKVKKMGIGG
ncbi:Extensin domain containing protein [Parasponia andersonii]|uniref:Extensin domain containing protein n=1 Tax=Parasponia andersonii TaxID=3476 RepID=A0A2P5DNR5_PARAD|nr:Extensin domain containing protein [Parasponia andersonii]